MSRATQWICNHLTVIALLSFVTSNVGCAAFEGKTSPKNSGLPQEKIFYGTFDDVWRAVQLALQGPNSYPLRINNMDTGVIESELVKGSAIWVAPNSEQPAGGGYSYRLVIRVVKGNLSGRQAFKVNVQKVAQMQRDFFADPEPITSDGLEEKVILYRVDREMQVDRALKRLNKKQNQGS